MSTFKIYTTAFVANLIFWLASILFGFSDLSGIVNFFTFVIALLYFVFSLEEVPSFDKLKIPEVHNFYKSRQNSYGNFIGIEFAILSFLFFLMVYIFEFSLGLTSLVLWFISIPASYFITKKVATIVLKEKVNDYLFLMLPNSPRGQIRQIVSHFFKSESLEKASLTAIPGFDSDLLEKCAILFIEYIELESTKLLGSEIKEINKF
jgi:hypothetical protein